MEVDFHLSKGDKDDVQNLYECVVEEVTLEGLDGITFQGLVERLIDRERRPISRDESVRVLASLWEAIKRDARLHLYLLPIERPTLQLYNRCLRTDIRGVFEEPPDAPGDIYEYSCVEEFNTRSRIKEKSKCVQLTQEDVNRIDLTKMGHSSADTEIEGIRFGKLGAHHSTSLGSVKRQPSSGSKGTLVKQSTQTSRKSRQSEKNTEVSEGKKLTKRSRSKKGNNAVGSEEDVAISDSMDKSVEKLPLIRGSCASYIFRKDVTKLVRKLGISYLQAVQMLAFGNRLVIVANQFLRESMLFCGHARARISGPQYCVVERIGRSRNYGEQGRGKVSLTCMKIDAKTQFYFRKTLLQDGFITKQGLIMRFPGGRTGTLISLFHLPHFFKRVDSAEDINIRKMFAHICNSPLKAQDYYGLQNIFGKFLMRTLHEQYSEFVTIDEESYAVVHPDEYAEEEKEVKRNYMMKRKVKVVRLRNPNLGIREVIQKQFKAVTEEDEDETLVFEVDENVGDKEEGAEYDWNSCYEPSVENPLELEASQVIRFVIARGNRGVVQDDLAHFMQVTALDARSALRYLSKWKVVKSITEDRGKVRIFRYIYTKCDGPTFPLPPSSDEEEPAEEEIRPSAFLETSISDGLLPECTRKDAEIMTALSPEAPPITILEGFEDEEEVEQPVKRKIGKRKGMPGLLSLQQGEDGRENQNKSKQSNQSQPIDVENVDGFTEDIVYLDPENAAPLPTKKKRKRKATNLQKLSWDEIQAKITNNTKENKRPPAKRRKYSDMYDEVDKKALELLKRQRVDWTPQEDRVILYLFIASIAFIPRYNIQKVFIFNSAQIRDILHRVLEHSRTKTTLAVRRRIHHLMKNRVFYAQYRNYLNSTLQDEDLYTQLIEPFLPIPSVTIFHPIPTNALYRVYEYLKNKFETAGFDHEKVDENINMEDLISKREMRKMEIIWSDVWGNVFKKFKPKKRYIYPKLDSQVASSGTESLITADAVNEDEISIAEPVEEEKEGRSILPDKPYTDEQLTYVLQIAKNIMDNVDASDSSSSESEDEAEDKFCPTIFRPQQQDVQPSLSAPARRKSKPSAARKDDRELRRIELKDRRLTDSKKIDIVTCERDSYNDNDLRIWVVRTAVMSMMFSGENYSSVEAFLSSISDQFLTKGLGALRSEGIIGIQKPVKKFTLSLQMKKLLSINLVPKAFQVANSLLSSLFKKEQTSLKMFYDLGSAFLLSEIAPFLKLNVMLPEPIITVHSQWEREYKELLKSDENLAVDKENFALRLLRLKLNSHVLSSPSKLVEKDFFDINLPQTTLQRCPTEVFEDLMETGVRPNVAVTKLFMETNLIKIVDYDEESQTFGTQKDQRILGEHEWLYNIISICEEVGVSVKYLVAKFTNNRLRSSLTYLLDCNYVYIVGTKNRKVVAATFMKNWTCCSYFKTSYGSSILRRVVVCPWMHSDGNLNWTFLDKTFTAIIGIVTRCPVIMVEELCRSLSPLLSSVEIMTLLTIMHSLKLVDFYKMRRKRHVGPFTSSKILSEGDIEGSFKNYKIDPFLDIEELYVELLPFHTFRYAQLQKVLHVCQFEASASSQTQSEASLHRSSAIPAVFGVFEEESVLGHDDHDVPDVLI